MTVSERTSNIPLPPLALSRQPRSFALTTH